MCVRMNGRSIVHVECHQEMEVDFGGSAPNQRCINHLLIQRQFRSAWWLLVQREMGVHCFRLTVVVALVIAQRSVAVYS